MSNSPRKGSNQPQCCSQMSKYPMYIHIPGQLESIQVIDTTDPPESSQNHVQIHPPENDQGAHTNLNTR